MTSGWRQSMCFAVVAFALLPSRAALIPGSGILTDTETGLEWVRLDTLPEGFTWSEAASYRASEGYRLATVAEVTTLFAHAGITPDHGSGLNPDVVRLLDLWGTSFEGVAAGQMVSYASFWLADQAFEGAHVLGQLAQTYELGSNLPLAWNAFPFVTYRDDNMVHPTDDAFALVRQIPEPHTWQFMLLGSAIVGVVVTKRRRSSATARGIAPR